jgi:hypothetical protein
MLEAQRQCLNVVKKLMKSKDGWLFEVPVDWKLLQIPDYPDVVTNPMDLGTAKAKLEASKYSSVADFVADIELIWQNAIDYNGEESEMGEVALNMRADFQEKMQEVDKGASLKQTTPSKPAVSDAQAPKSNGGKASAAGSSSAPVKRSHHKAVEEGGVGNGSKVKAERPRSHHKPVGSGGVGNVGQVKLQKAEPGDKASGSALPAAGTGKLAGVKAVVLHLLKQKDAWLFGEPVDWKALGLTDYPLVVKRPMDLGTILKRIEKGRYSSQSDVAEDISLVWSNAMAYNIEGSEIYTTALSLKGIADRKLVAIDAQRAGPQKAAPAQKPAPPPKPPAPPPQPEVTFAMKKKLNENCALLTCSDLFGLISLVEKECVGAGSQPVEKDNELEIDLDNFDTPCFLKLEKYVEDCIKQQKGRQ